MRQSILLTAVLGTLSFAQVSYAAEAEEKAPAAIEAKSPWAATANIGFVSDYYARGISQNWHKPSVQGGLDITHDSGFYVGAWGSNVTPNTFPDATAEVDVYGGYNGAVPGVEGLGYSVGLIGYLYPGGSWKKYRGSASLGPDGANTVLTPRGGRWDTAEVNFGLAYGWLSTKLSVTLTDWFGAERATGWDGSTKGSTYFEVNANYPLPWWDLTLVGHVGQLNVNGKLDTTFSSDGGTNLPSSSFSGASSPDYTDYKIGLSKAFKIGASEGWNGGIYYVGASNKQYWGENGYGGTSFNGKGDATRAQSKDLNEGRLVLTLTRTF
jgi:uncharacterized protein (TIGR02001 family)